MRKNIFLLFFLSCLGFTSASAAGKKDIAAPLGLQWGMTKDDIYKITGNLTEAESKNNVDYYSVKNADESIDELERYSIGIDRLYGLSSVDLIFYIKDYKSGSKSIDKYNVLKKALVSKYGEQFASEYLWRNRNKNSISFYDCIKNDRCGNFVSVFEDDKGGKAMLMLVATDSDRKVHPFLLYKSPVIRKLKNSANNRQADAIQKEAESVADSL